MHQVCGWSCQGLTSGWRHCIPLCQCHMTLSHISEATQLIFQFDRARQMCVCMCVCVWGGFRPICQAVVIRGGVNTTKISIVQFVAPALYIDYIIMSDNALPINLIIFSQKSIFKHFSLIQFGVYKMSFSKLGQKCRRVYQQGGLKNDQNLRRRGPLL